MARRNAGGRARDADRSNLERLARWAGWRRQLTSRGPSSCGGQTAGRRIEALPGDASSRSYVREWHAAGKTVVRAQYAAGHDAEMGRDLEAAAWLAGRGVRLARVLESDLGAGWVVVEDLGRCDAEAVLRVTPGRLRLDLALRLIGPLETLAAIPPADLPPWNAPLDRGRLRWELAGFEMWFLGHLGGRTPRPGAVRWLDAIADKAADHPRRVCHRDYHVNNLFFLDRQEVAVIDAQDVLVGPDTYDVVSLVGERSIPDLLDAAQRDQLLEAWALRTGAAPGWRQRCSLVRMQRALKVLGTFARLVASGRPRYRPWLVSLARELETDAAALGAPPDITEALRWVAARAP